MEIKRIKDPQLFISVEAKKIFDNLRELDEFKTLDNKDLFMLAVVFGYKTGKGRELKSKDKTESGFTRERYLSDSDNCILKAIAIKHDNKVDVIRDIQRVYSIAEEYANEGVYHLKDFVFSNPASFAKKYAEQVKAAESIEWTSD